jgi:plasmid stabilization system protein ParE
MNCRIIRNGNPLDQDPRCFSVSKFPSRVVYYKPLADEIIVIRVLHGARDADRIFGKGEEAQGE